MNEVKSTYCPDGYADQLDDNGDIIERGWRLNLPANSCQNSQFSPNVAGRTSENAKLIRDCVKEYVNGDRGALAWQTMRVLGLIRNE